MRFMPFAAAALIAAAPVAFISTTPSPLRAQDAANPNTDVVSNEKFVADLEYLASDDLKGRSAADQTIRVAAGYLVDRMSEIGLEMNAIDGDALQEVKVFMGAGSAVAGKNQITVKRNESETESVSARLGDGMSPLAIGNLKGDVKARLAFAGYGITADRFDYDDYGDVDVAGAIVIILRGEPRASDPNSRFAGTKDTVHAKFVTKVINAMQHGASAVVFVNNLASVEKDRESVRERIDGELARKKSLSEQLKTLPKGLAKARETLQKKVAAIDAMVSSLEEDRERAAQGVLGIADAGQRPENQVAVPVISLACDVVDQILHNAGRDSLERIEQQIDESTAPASFEIDDVTAHVTISQKPNRVASDKRSRHLCEGSWRRSNRGSEARRCPQGRSHHEA